MFRKIMLFLFILCLLAGCQQPAEKPAGSATIEPSTEKSYDNPVQNADEDKAEASGSPENETEPVESTSPPNSTDDMANEAMKARLAALIDKTVQETNFQGTIHIRYENSFLIDASYGLADRQTSRPHTDDTQYMIASMSKQFTAMCIMILEERGLLSTADTLDRFYVDFPSGNLVTIHHLLTHTSGLPVFINLGKGETLQEQVVNAIKEKKIILRSPPGASYLYSDTGFVLLSAIIETVTGKSYEDFLKENILNPLEMSHTGIGYDREKNPDLAIGYGPGGSTLPDPSSASVLRYGAGALYTTTDDFDKWMDALSSNILISQETIEKMFTRYVDVPDNPVGYGYGFFINDTGYPHKVVLHGGMLISKTFTGFMILCPAQKISISIFGNDQYHDNKKNLAFSCLQTLLDCLETE